MMLITKDFTSLNILNNFEIIKLGRELNIDNYMIIFLFFKKENLYKN